jgi:hypothetical protein
MDFVVTLGNLTGHGRSNVLLLTLYGLEVVADLVVDELAGPGFYLHYTTAISHSLSTQVINKAK